MSARVCYVHGRPAAVYNFSFNIPYSKEVHINETLIFL